jgi:hypothetical protein
MASQISSNSYGICTNPGRFIGAGLRDSCKYRPCLTWSRDDLTYKKYLQVRSPHLRVKFASQVVGTYERPGSVSGPEFHLMVLDQYDVALWAACL